MGLFLSVRTQKKCLELLESDSVTSVVFFSVAWPVSGAE